MTKPKKNEKSGKKPRSPHTIPPPISVSVLTSAVVKRSRHEERDIREYVEWQSPREKVTHLEKVLTETIYDNKYDVWDVRTTGTRYWVITTPTNLYSQKLFPSLDYTLSFHVGVTIRMIAHEKQNPADPLKARLINVWRRLAQAAEGLDQAEEAEDLQAVGMRCRECLIALIRALANPSMVLKGQEAPKAADFSQWSELIANAIASGSSASEIRGYIKAISKSTWQLVNWLTHASNASNADARMALDATEHTLSAFSEAFTRFESGMQDRCPRCASYQVVSLYRPEIEIDPPYVTLCESCGWTSHQIRAETRKD